MKVLTAAQIEKIHHVIIRNIGGSQTLRNPSILGFTLNYIKNNKEDLLTNAAVLLRNITVNEPFLDRNMIIGFIAADVLLRMNGWYIRAMSLKYLEQLHTKSLQDIAKTIDHSLA